MKLPALLFVILLSISCKESQEYKSLEIERKFGNNIERNCRQNKDCVVAIKDVTDFSWDKLYVFDYGIDKYEIDKIVGINVNASDNNTRKLIFIKDNELVYLEQNLSIVDKAAEGEIIFLEMDRKNFAEYNFNAQFKPELFDNSYKVGCINCNY